MDYIDTTRLLISFRIGEINHLLGNYTEVIPYIGCKEAISDIKKAQDSLEAAIEKFRIQELLSRYK